MKHFRHPNLPIHSFLFLGVLLLLPCACRKSEFLVENGETITDQGGGTGTATWTRDREYLLNGFVFVNDGQVLTIEAGTVVRARTGQGSLASALIVARGGTIIAEGTKSDPIVFTVEGDDLKGSIPLEARGLWGGVILLGSAHINTESGEEMIEGIPISEPRGIYGGSDEDDNSGILRYVSIRHGGTNIGEGNEINGLTLGGVGRKTTIDHVEVISNADDGVEIFGGDVNCSNLVVSFCGDDAFDLDLGYHGKGQFWLAINSIDSDKCAEITGGVQPVPALPDSQPVIYNATFIRSNQATTPISVHFLQHGGGFLRNCILLNPGSGVALQYTDQPGDSWALFQSGRLAVENSIFYPGSSPDSSIYAYAPTGDFLESENRVLRDSVLAWHESYMDPGLSDLNGYVLLPPSTLFENLAPYSNSWFEQVTFKGAFGSNNWIEGWTLLYESGLIKD